MTQQHPIIRQALKGTVVSDKMTKTLVVAVTRRIRHPLYAKAYTRTRKFKVHDERQMYHVGDVVTFVACRPLSKEKRWRVVYPHHHEEHVSL